MSDFSENDLISLVNAVQTHKHNTNPKNNKCMINKGNGVYECRHKFPKIAREKHKQYMNRKNKNPVQKQYL